METETASELRLRVLEELRSAGFVEDQDGLLRPPDGDSKEVIRGLHAARRSSLLRKKAQEIRENEDYLLTQYAHGKEIDPSSIQPEVRAVASDEDALLFRYATLHWSIPVSQGYGRRTRFLVRDSQNGKLMGVFALGDPVYNLRVRDDLIGWDSEQRGDRLYNVFDGFVMGAVGAYRQLLGGKMIAFCAVSDAATNYLTEKYRGSVTEIRKLEKIPRPVLITTTSALGRSSVYNRLKMDDRYVFRSVGFTEGYGHFQFSDGLFWDLVEFLEAQRGEIRGNKYGQGPNWKMRTLRTALEAIELPGELLKHGVRREVFLAPLGQGWRSFLRGETDDVDWFDYSLERLSKFWRERWAIPRAERRPGFEGFDPTELRLRDAVDELDEAEQEPLPVNW